MRRQDPPDDRPAGERDGAMAAAFHAAEVEPTGDERRRLLAAAEPILAGHAARELRNERVTAGTDVPWTERLRALLRPHPVLAGGLAAAAIGAIVLTMRTPSRESAATATRSAAVVTWEEHERNESASPFPLVSAGFGRAY